MDKKTIIIHILVLVVIVLLLVILTSFIDNRVNEQVRCDCAKQNFTGVVGEPGFEIQCTDFLDDDGLVNNECKRIEKRKIYK